MSLSTKVEEIEQTYLFNFAFHILQDSLVVAVMSVDQRWNALALRKGGKT